MKEAAEKKNIELENENEKMAGKIRFKIFKRELKKDSFFKNLRESTMIISDLENKMNETLEQLALVQTQLELNQNQSQIQVERLKQQLKGSLCFYK